MHKKLRTPVGSLLVFASFLAAACGDSPSSAPYAGSGDSPGDGYGQPPISAAAGSAALPPANNAGATQTGASPAGTPDVALASGAAFQGYLTDAMGRPLYMFGNDIPGSNESACAAACLDKWPVFDVKQITVGTGLTATDFNRFMRADGAWQTTFKGHPLYRFAMDAATGVSGDGASGRWFVARDYLAFIAAKADLTPQGSAAPAPYMTNRMGRTVYVFMNDTPGTASSAPVSACADACLDAWPTWNAPATLGSPMLPSTMKSADFGLFERVVAGTTVKQLTYRGWPLYFHTPDMAPGTTTGHMTGAWRAIDPMTFGSGAAASAPKP